MESAFVLVPALFFMLLFAIQVLLMLFVFALVIGLLIFWVMMLLDVVQRNESEFSTANDKVVWVLVVALAGYIGAIIYYFVVKRNLKK